jgi:hypothetical protein
MSHRNEIMGIVSGIFLLMGLHLAALILVSILCPIFISIGGIAYYIASFLCVVFVGIGIAQLIYVVPAIIVLRRRREFARLKGLIIGAIITALLNGGCWLLIYASWK